MAVININRNQFEEMVHSGKTVLVEFSAPWCVYCRRLAPALESVAEEYKDTLIFTAVNIDDEPELAETEAIEVVPTLLIYHSGQTLGSIVAPESRAQLVAFIEETLQHRTQEVNNAQHIYDMIVVGGGPGGYTAALYAARAGMDTVVLEKLSAGGQMALTEQIDNYPGFEDGIDGFSLGEKMKRGTERFGVETKLTEVLSLELSGSVKKAVTSEGAMYAKSIVLATGAGPRELGVDGEQELIGKGVHYCAACDGMFYRNKTVVIAGGGNTAAADALILSRICKKVIVVHRRGTLKATKIYHEPLMKAENVEKVKVISYSLALAIKENVGYLLYKMNREQIISLYDESKIRENEYKGTDKEIQSFTNYYYKSLKGQLLKGRDPSFFVSKNEENQSKLLEEDEEGEEI